MVAVSTIIYGATHVSEGLHAAISGIGLKELRRGGDMGTGEEGKKGRGNEDVVETALYALVAVCAADIGRGGEIAWG